MSATVQLVGLDFGTTTSSAVVASAQLVRSAATGRMELAELAETYRSEMVFTPLCEDGRLDERTAAQYLDAWLAAAAVQPENVFGGGALLTGLIAQKDNAAALVRLIRQRLANALVATADDPCLESWLSFMGSCRSLSRAHPDKYFLNLDIGGGTTNIALGLAGEVLRTGCLFVGARHIQVIPGTYRIVQLSRYARALFDHLGPGLAKKGPGDLLTDADVEAVLDFYLNLLHAIVLGNAEPFQQPVARLHEPIPFLPSAELETCAVTFSGGVAELLYAHLEGKPWPPTTHFGDLGIDLARRIVDSPVLAGHFKQFRPRAGGRATVYGLLRHNTEVSGTTLFLPRPEILPLTDIPILGKVTAVSSNSHIAEIVNRILHSARGGCIQIAIGSNTAASVRSLGAKISCILQAASFPTGRPLVLLVEENVGKVLGHYVTAWGKLGLDLVVVDEVAPRDAQYVQIGAVHGQVVPVSFFGLNEQGDAP